MESRWTLENSMSDFRGQNSMACGVLYIIGNLFEHRCLKWVHIAHLESKTQVMAKRRAENQIASLTPDQKKLGIDSIYLTAEGMQHTIRKLSTRIITLFKTTSRFEVYSQSYGVPKSQESQLARFRDFHLRVPEENSHLDVGSVANHRVYYKGEGDGFPQVWAVVNLVCPCCPWLILAPKVFQLCTNHFVWVVCRPV